uniref:Elongation factor 1-beta n=1 Tax=Oncorhynchus mykiss TaxID=8022 RepID=A0A8K9XHF6_ONCMY
MGFGDLKTPGGLKVLNDFLADKSYIEGWVPSQADVAVFDAIPSAPSTVQCHALRWYNHIKSFQNQKGSLPGVKKPLGQYGPSGVEDNTAADSKDDDDDMDLFGSDDEVTASCLEFNSTLLILTSQWTACFGDSVSACRVHYSGGW